MGREVGGIGGKRRRGQQRMRWLDGPSQVLFALGPSLRRTHLKPRLRKPLIKEARSPLPQEGLSLHPDKNCPQVQEAPQEAQSEHNEQIQMETHLMHKYRLSVIEIECV